MNDYEAVRFDSALAADLERLLRSDEVAASGERQPFLDGWRVEECRLNASGTELLVRLSTELGGRLEFRYGTRAQRPAGPPLVDSIAEYIQFRAITVDPRSENSYSE